MNDLAVNRDFTYSITYVKDDIIVSGVIAGVSVIVVFVTEAAGFIVVYIRHSNNCSYNSYICLNNHCASTSLFL